ncbi:hypothetical protein TIFTF001_015256 [Ficus carica]|uniref:Uncharacterized protein n=1 Tax=Ficus carica TaxID=3494 RepID=A0AA88A6U6_FICCA|nr:hypothetical protein TIFTF001_015256 [Ficus carica]
MSFSVVVLVRSVADLKSRLMAGRTPQPCRELRQPHCSPSFAGSVGSSLPDSTIFYRVFIVSGGGVISGSGVISDSGIVSSSIVGPGDAWHSSLGEKTSSCEFRWYAKHGNRHICHGADSALLERANVGDCSTRSL